MSDTWMPLYVGDYLSATTRLTTEQHGAYFLLLLDYWKSGPPPNDDAVLAQIVRMPINAWRKAKPALIGFFDIEGGKLIQKRVERERNKAIAKVEERSKAGKAGAASKWGSKEEASRALRSERLAEARRKGKHTSEEWAALLAFCGHSCVRCGSADRIVKDHIAPIYQGGSDAIENLQPLCGSCNSSKGPDGTDHRPNGWQTAVKMPSKLLVNGCQTPAPSPSPSPASNEALSSSNEDVSAEPTAKPLTKQEVIDAWQSRMVPQGFPAIRKITGQRDRQLSARLRDSTLEEWLQAMAALERSAFCRGENDRGWRADFDFLLQPRSFTKLLEGAYDH